MVRPAPEPGQASGAALAPALRSASSVLSLVAAAVIWVALLGPVITLFFHVTPQAVSSALRAPGALTPLVVSLQSGVITLIVLICLGTPLAWMMARGRLPWPRLWEAACSPACCCRRW